MRRILCCCLSVAAILTASIATADDSLTDQVLKTIVDFPVGRAPVEELRQRGPAGLEDLFRIRVQVEAQLKTALADPPKDGHNFEAEHVQRQLSRLDGIIDQ